MRASELATLPANYMFWDKDLCKYATIDDVRPFVSIEPNTYGTDFELRLQCLGRFRRLAFTGMTDKNKRPVYEGHIVKVNYKVIEARKLRLSVLLGSKKAALWLLMESVIHQYYQHSIRPT